MHSSRLPLEDRCRGLAERPDAVFIHEPALSSEIGLSAKHELEPPRSVGLDLDVMSKQLEIACRFGAIIERIAARHGLLPSIIAGFCSRRSGLGLNLLPNGPEGTRDFELRTPKVGHRQPSLPPDGLGFVRGLMGLDFERHAAARTSQWRDPASNMDAAFALIVDYRTTLRRRTTLQGEGLLRASFTAFECGLKAVERSIRLGLDVDSPTPGWNQQSDHGCGWDVIARAGFFQAEGWD